MEDRDLIAFSRLRETALLEHRLVLYAGANYPGEAARNAYAPALSAYPAMGPRYAKEQPDTQAVSRIEEETENAVCRLFSARWAETRLPSCTLANMAVFHAFSKPGDLLLAPAAAHGGHLSQRRGGTPELAGLRVEDLPFDARTCTLDAPAAADMVRALRPRLVMLGRSVMLTPDDIGPVTAAARETGSLVIFDASHVSGLIAGGTFPNPLQQGADILTSSTYKTLPGRPQGLVAGMREEHGRTLCALVDARLIANYDAGKLPSLLATLDEVAAHGSTYAARIVSNTARLARALACRGIPLVEPLADAPRTHQLLVSLGCDPSPSGFVARLQDHGILLGTCPDPRRPGCFALRLGTQFITRQGFAAREVEAVADLLCLVLKPDGEGTVAIRQASDAAGTLARIADLLASVNRKAAGTDASFGRKPASRLLQD